ncbi:hypothetical protein HWV62_15747 [Athelia sp. TMB]|nr:hypothetical protein HWV62_15747 [Athelia sp. TMB]
MELTRKPGLAMAAVTRPFVPALFDFDADQTPNPPAPLSLFEIIRKVYDSDVLHPVMPYDNDALLSARIAAVADGPAVPAIRALVAQWLSPAEETRPTPADLARKHEEVTWLATLLVAGSGRAGRAPRLDFFLMHVLNSALFLPALLALLPPARQARLLQAYTAVAVFLLITRGRPRIDPALMMTYSATPAPPRALKFPPSPDAVGDPNDLATANPWDVIVPCVLHAPDSHVVKSIRALYYAAQHFGHTAAGGAPGALDKDGGETHKGIKEMDGSIFFRAAGVVMDQLGWVTYGEKAGSWDGSAHGWDDAWKNED